jgi:hypothetical protein
MIWLFAYASHVLWSCPFFPLFNEILFLSFEKKKKEKVIVLWKSCHQRKFQIVNYHRRCKSTTEDEEQDVFGENLRIAFIT